MNFRFSEENLSQKTNKQTKQQKKSKQTKKQRTGRKTSSVKLWPLHIYAGMYANAYTCIYHNIHKNK